MIYDNTRINELLEKIYNRIRAELYQRNAVGEVDQFISSLGFGDLIENYNTAYNPREARILVLGASSLNDDDIRNTFKGIGISPKSVDLITDYGKIKHFDFKQKLRYSSVYSDVIVGPQAHKGVNIEGYSSAIEMMRSEPEAFPKITEAKVNGELKISKESLRNAIQKTQYYMDIFS